MASAFYDSHVQRMQSYVQPVSGNQLGSCGQLPSSRISASYQLPSTGHQLSNCSYVTPPTSLHAGSSLLPNGGNQSSSYYQLPSTGNLGGVGFSNYMPNNGCTSMSQYSVNQEVEIYSESTRGWVSGVISKIGNNGTATVKYNANQKIVPIEHQHTHLRPAASGINQPRTTPLGNPVQSTANWYGGAPKFEFHPSAGDGPRPGTEVEYYSTTHCGWVQARISRVRPNGNYDLDCKADVPPEKTRRVDPLRQGGICDNEPPKRVAPSYDNFGPPPPQQVGTFQFDLAALCGVAPPQTGFANNASPPYSNYAEPQDCAPNTFYDDDAPYNDQPSFLIDLAQAVQEAEGGDPHGHGPRRIETEYLAW